jgi:hypothetical protein
VPRVVAFAAFKINDAYVVAFEDGRVVYNALDREIGNELDEAGKAVISHAESTSCIPVFLCLQ